ncbi:Crossover junction endodeoxyribonuclease RuvC [Candidatus Kinetoplastibacterium sorsogonicusi]|uniref:Crossover junction endodeoxyribonuclease RuvC n=1 Tax=Candidatus Kinetoplastidibacterium kentomonadis TaxID=1576550 RepID=A0A3Q8ERJ3_9PROT|nr:crossover junction endodeoxyribonuclease RuvC [Candidatus Kinetoplastibacterium sorsogonicusi]AWD32629.1 Crossover junction endodeoxyribonuclease RuvC [Candidatus Kinetoplastibacterium sorsogonicusi]
MRILGIDPGLRHTGFGVIDIVGSKSLYVISGTVDVPNNLTMIKRLKIIMDSLKEIALETKPNVAAMEIIFLNNNPATTLLLGQARGAAMCAIANMSIPLYEYTALQIKKSIVGNGRASKYQIQIMVKNLLSLNNIPSEDSADALACSLCHANTFSIKNKLSINQNMIIDNYIKKIKNGRYII